ncbi:beta-ketoacyl synthase N-terminal-like domain-containing protein [Pseudochelatococcus contaminans]|uniref:Polyketide synthase PksN n=1 Tax=Pseudochelatococcus contaminans TaxID=1538103 RepID=A0A7W5Z6M3_9HYPH|nr:polyketide synthase [Pseudochelatococcus contaminans]MBB3811108.1 polyketide synthase PksN [Pseudochelatococcus contaminans]
MSGPGHEPVAVIGMYGRFPGATDLRAFWGNLCAGHDAVGPVPGERWQSGEGDEAGPDVHEPERVYQGGFMPWVDRFDHRFFGILLREAQSMDPQQRLFLQAAWGALEDAGQAPSHLAQRPVGVFVGVGHADYPVLLRRDGVPSDPWRGTGIALTAIANRLSFCLDLRGPSESIDTACSSSLVAIHRAAQALRDGECELAIVGGVNLLLGPELFVAFDKAGMLGQGGRCRTFDTDADGYVRGEGVAALVLMPLRRAIAHGEYIYGHIRGSALNHGGRAHSFTAPNPQAQADVISRAWASAGESLRQAVLIETHGTGTPLGDPIEVNALKMAWRAAPAALAAARDGIALGALKSHIGHLEAAAGVASVVKTLLSLQQCQVVGNLHHRQLNPHIHFEETPFNIPTRTSALGDGPALAGVSSFGFGGVNAHVVLQAHVAADDTPQDSADAAPYLILLSAKTPAALRERVRQLHAFLTPSATQHDSLLERLRQRLGLPDDDAWTGATRLADLPVSAYRFIAALHQSTEDLGLPHPGSAWRGALSVGEITARLSHEAKQPGQPDEHLACAPVLPEHERHGAGLARIARSLQEGRDAMAERLAFVATRREDLLEILARYLAAAHKENAGWHASAPGQPAIDAPAPTTTRLDAAGLERWAAHWCSGKAPSPAWEDLYGQEPRPHKLPLPAYPFALTRVWYEKPEASHSTSLLPVIAWAERQRHGAELPASLMALPCLIMQAQASTGGNIRQWSDLQFGPPAALTRDAAFECRSFTSHGRRKTQVISGGQVLLQASEGAPPSPLPPLILLDSREGTTQPGEDIGWLRNVRRSAAGLSAELQPDCGTDTGQRFWSGLLHALISALRLTRSASARQLPYRISHLSVAAQASAPNFLRISPASANGLLDLWVSDADNLPLLRLDGIELRSWHPLNRLDAQVREAVA